MRMRNGEFEWLAAICLAAVILFANSDGAYAQTIRNWDRRVAVGEEIEFQWLNYDEKTCKDRGHARLIINTPPSKGSYRAVRRMFTQQNGKCTGKEFSVLLVYYVAGQNKGRDRTSYTIRGNGDIRVNLTMRIY